MNKDPIWFRIMRGFELLLICQLLLGSAMMYVAPDFMWTIFIWTHILALSSFLWLELRWKIRAHIDLKKGK